MNDQALHVLLSDLKSDLAALRGEVAALRGVQEIRVKVLEEDHACLKTTVFDALDAHAGFDKRLDRLERAADMRRWHLRALWTGWITITVGFISARLESCHHVLTDLIHRPPGGGH